MTYALGLELAADAVRVASMSTPDALERDVEEQPPVLFCDAGSSWAGRDALERGAGRSQGFVNDVVAGFTMDRLFLTAGRLLTPDQALRELIWGIACQPARTRQEWPGAVTVSCPDTWSPAAVTRATEVVEGLRLQRARVVVGYPAASASADAFARLPADAPVVAAAAVPDLFSGHRREVAPAEQPPGTVPHRTELRRSRVPVLASLAAVFGLVVILGIVLLMNHQRSPIPPTSPLTSGTTIVTTR